MHLRKILSFSFVLMLALTGCHTWDNFTTYFNTFYNAERLRKESELEFEYQEEKTRVKPRVFIPDKGIETPSSDDKNLPPFLAEFVINKTKLQPVKVKLDSIIIKGSKILAKHPKSDYIQQTLYLMALSFYYQNIWLSSQIKCSELIDRYPDGELSPDAHLLLVKDLLVQKKYLAGKTLLSRCIDVAWQLQRYDILSEAFRIEAELAILDKDYDGAVRPYRQAIAQTDDEQVKARWQVDMASILFRLNKFEQAEKMFARVRMYDPDYQALYESYLYQASCFSRLGKFDKAEKILDGLESNRNWDEWKAYTFAERMNMYRLHSQDTLYNKASKYADTAFIGSDAVAAINYERGIDYFGKKEYMQARQAFSKSRNVVNPAAKQASYLYKLLVTWEEKRIKVVALNQAIYKEYKDTVVNTDSLRNLLALYQFEMARVQHQLGNKDSALYYYQAAVGNSPMKNPASARYLYAYARFEEDSNPALADSLYELIVELHPLTDYGVEARKRQGYTSEYVIDTVAELYTSGTSLRRTKQYDLANMQFLKILDNYPKSKFIPRTLYTVGWVYENNIRNYDSALIYYQLLLEKYPMSEYAQDIKLSVDYLAAKRSNDKLPDSLKSKLKEEEKKRERERQALYDQQRKPLEALQPEPQQQRKARSNKQEVDVQDAINNPMDFFKKTFNDATNTDDITNSAKDQFNKVSNVDSLKNSFMPSIKFENPLDGFKRDTSQKKTDLPNDPNQGGGTGNPGSGNTGGKGDGKKEPDSKPTDPGVKGDPRELVKPKR